jgi:hypothetical protein
MKRSLLQLQKQGKTAELIRRPIALFPCKRPMAGPPAQDSHDRNSEEIERAAAGGSPLSGE